MVRNGGLEIYSEMWAEDKKSYSELIFGDYFGNFA